MLPLIFAGVTAVASITGTYLFTKAHYERELSELRAAQADAIAQANTAALAETQRLQAAKDKALKAAAVRQSDLARAAAVARNERDGLRDELSAARVQLSSASCASVRDHAAALNTVFGQCAAAIERLAGQADGHAADAMMLQDAWPR